MRTIVTGTVGLDKRPYLEKVVGLARQAGEDVTVCHVGQRMYAEAPDVAEGRILDLPISRLNNLRRSVFKDILSLADQTPNIIVNTHATFRWKHGLFPAFDFDQIAGFDADLYICLVDNVDSLHARLVQDHQIDHSLKDLLVWREEESLATEIMMLGCNWARRANETGLSGSPHPQGDSRVPPASSVMAASPEQPDPHAESGSSGSSAASGSTAPFDPGRVGDSPLRAARFYVMALGPDNCTAESFFRLMFRPRLRKAYLSFPMTHVVDQPGILAEIDSFRRALSTHLIVFDPADLEEQQLYLDALAASERGHKVMEVDVLGQKLRFDVAEVMRVAGDIHAQIYARDFVLIDQADMIVSYIPEMPNGKPGLSSGVERELQHAHEATKDVYVVWAAKAGPSPFITETATRLFDSVDQALHYFKKVGYIGENADLGGHNDTLFPVW